MEQKKAMVGKDNYGNLNADLLIIASVNIIHGL